MEPRAAGSGSTGVPGGIGKSVPARATGASKEAAAKTTRTIDGLLETLDLRRGVFIKKEEGKRGAVSFTVDSFNVNSAKALRHSKQSIVETRHHTERITFPPSPLTTIPQLRNLFSVCMKLNSRGYLGTRVQV